MLLSRVRFVFSSLAVSCARLRLLEVITHLSCWLNFACRVSKASMKDGIIASFNSYSWPFYSWLVALAHKVLFFSQVEQTAHFINALFISLSCMLFIRIYAEITNHKGSIWVAAVFLNRYQPDLSTLYPWGRVHKHTDGEVDKWWGSLALKGSQILIESCTLRYHRIYI